MKKIILLAVGIPLLASADLKRLSAFGFQPSPADENRVQVQGWEKISSSQASSYGAYTRNSPGSSPETKAQDGMSIYKWDTKSETSLSPKTIIITTAFMSPDEKDKNLREIYIYDYDRKFQLEGISYCEPGLQSCASVSPKSCGQNKPVDQGIRTSHFRILTSHYIGVGTSLSSSVAEKFKMNSARLSKMACQYYFKNVGAILKNARSEQAPDRRQTSKKTGSH